MTPSRELPAQPDDFDPVWYLATYSDVRAAGLDPWTHYCATGRREGRQTGRIRALELDHMLWRGFENSAYPALQSLLQSGPSKERAAAGWALARWEADRQNWAGALRAIQIFHDQPDGVDVIAHPGPFLLAVTLGLRCNDINFAEHIMSAAERRFGHLPDLELAAMTCAKARGHDDWELSSYLTRIYVSQGLAAVALADGVGSRFDRLSAPAYPRCHASSRPLVSAVMPVFNGAATLHTALRGLQDQTWRNLEILVIDDGSTDGSAAVARAVAKGDPRMRVIEQGRNQGAYAARNTGMAEASGEFITVQDADDWPHPEKIALQVEALMSDRDLKASVSHGVRVSDDLDMMRWRMEHGWIYRNVNSLMIRRDLRETLGYWDRVRVNADTEYYYRIIRAYGAAAIKEVCLGIPLTFLRTSPASLTGRAETHLRTALHGVRRDYMDAAHYWHEHGARPEDLYLPRFPEARPFRVVDEIGPADAPGPVSDYDVLAASALLDRAWYRLSFPDVLAADLCPMRHYLNSGARENRDPGPGFSTGGYRRAQGLGGDANPLIAYETVGRAKGASPLPTFQGALSDAPSRTLVFAHSAGKTLFGAERSLLDVVGRMAARGEGPVVVVPTLRNLDYLERLQKITVAVEVLPQLWRNALHPPHEATVSAIRTLIRKHGSRTIHVNTVVLDAPLIAARAEGCEAVVHVRELPAEDDVLCRNLGTDAGRLRDDLKTQADRFIVTSQPVANWLGCPERTRIRPNSVDEALFDLPLAPQSPLRVGLISSNIAKKGVADFIAVARLVQVAGRDVRFLLIGPPTRDLHLLMPLPENVEFRGYAATPTEAVSQADVVLSLSRFAESFGRTVLEAMAAGRPVVCYDKGAPPTLVQSGQSGFVVPDGSPQGAANAVMALDAARGQLMKMSVGARNRARALQRQALEP